MNSSIGLLIDVVPAELGRLAKVKVLSIVMPLLHPSLVTVTIKLHMPIMHDFLLFYVHS